MKVKITVECFDLNEEARKRMCTESLVQYQASIPSNMMYGIKGCPLGRSFVSATLAIYDLKNRVKMESGIVIDTYA